MKSKISKLNYQNSKPILIKINYSPKNIRKTPKLFNNYKLNSIIYNNNTITSSTPTPTGNKMYNKPWDNSNNIKKKSNNKKSLESSNN